jgi:hypothetical protein
MILLKTNPDLPSWNIFNLDAGEGGKTEEKTIAALYVNHDYHITVKDYPLNTSFFIYKDNIFQGDLPSLVLAMAGVESDILLADKEDVKND